MTKIYHNPRCSKSREALAILEKNNISPEIILYLKTPPSAKEISEILSLLSITPIELIRVKEKLFSELGLDTNKKLSDKKWCQIMSDNPSLIERPIVIHEGKACIGRPPENILKLI